MAGKTRISDKLQQECVKESAAAVVEQLKRAVATDPNRMIRQLLPIEAENMATAAISAWIKMRAFQCANEEGGPLGVLLRELDGATVLNDSLGDMLG